MSFGDLFDAIATGEPWREQAACRGKGPDLFFPERGQSSEAAKAICATCPVTRECEDYADRTRTTHGIWGGRIRKRHSISPPAAIAISYVPAPAEHSGDKEWSYAV